MNLPKMLSGQELTTALQILPEYRPELRQENAAVRLMTLSDLYQVYIPSAMSVEIYSKLYLALLRSMKKKCTLDAVRQRYENHCAIQQRECRGIIGGSDSFTIIGTSGIGKSSAIGRAISLVSEQKIIQLDSPHCKVIPCLMVQCPFDSSVKGLLLEILRKVDEELDTTYSVNAQKARTTTDMLAGSVASVCLNHIGLLVVDEIQNVVASKNGRNLIGALTQLINNSGISICMVGTPECTAFFEQAMQMARRSVGLQYTALPYDDYFQTVCQVLWQYQYVRQSSELTPAIIRWLYEHSAGVISIVVSLLHDAQELAILDGTEELNLTTLGRAYQQRLSFLHGYIQPCITQGKQTSTAKKATSISDTEADEKSEGKSVSECVAWAKAQGLDVAKILAEHFTVEEIAI